MGINDNGIIVGHVGGFPSGLIYGFAAAPVVAAVPEPGTLPVLAVCFIGLLARAYHQRFSAFKSRNNR